MSFKYNSLSASQKPLSIVADALKLDADNDDENAYLKYLESISMLALTLFDGQKYKNHDSRYLSVEQKLKLMSVARQCLDRVEALAHKLTVYGETVPDLVNHQGFPNYDRAKISSPSTTSNTIGIADIVEFREENSIPPLIYGSSTNRVGPLSKPSSDGNKSSVLEFIDWIASEDPNARTLQTSQPVETPMQKVQRDNQALVAAYRSRMDRNTNHVYRMNLSLELQRRLAENLNVARMKQEEYLRRQQEEQRVTLDEAAKRVTDTGDSKEFQRQQALYAKIIQYEHNQNWVFDCKNQLTRSPDDADLAESIVRRTLRDQRHPISVELRRRQTKIYNLLQTLIERSKTTSEDARKSMLKDDTVNSCNEDDDFNERNKSLDSDEEIDEHAVTRHRIADDVKHAREAFQSAIAANLCDIESSLDSANTVSASLKRSTKKSKRASKWSPIKTLAKFRVKEEVAFDRPDGESEAFSREEEEELELELARLETSALQKHLQTISGDIRQSIDDLIETMALTYTAMGEVANRERCYTVLEEHFFPDLWPQLMRLCQLVYGSDEAAVADAMRRLQGCQPEELGCGAQFADSLRAPEHLASAVALLKTIPEFSIPTKKLQNLVLVTKLLCRRNDTPADENKIGPKDKSIGADDLISLLNYICVNANVPQLISECHLLEELIHQRYLMGEEGYCLTSLTTALQYLKTVKRSKPEIRGIETTV